MSNTKVASALAVFFKNTADASIYDSNFMVEEIDKLAEALGVVPSDPGDEIEMAILAKLKEP